MRAFLIDPEARTLTTIDYDGELEMIYEVLDTGHIEAVHFGDNEDSVYVDGERRHSHFFLIEGHPTPLGGKGLVVGLDSEGRDIEPQTTEDWLRNNLDFGSIMHIGDLVMFMGDRHRRAVN